MPDTMMTPESPAFLNRSGEIDKLAAALVKAQATMAGAKKDSENPHFKNAYADLASVWDAVRKPLTDNGLAVVQFPRTVENGAEIETTLLHTSGQYMRDVLWVPASKQDAQGLGSAITYGRRYALMAVCGIAPVDDDGNAAAATYKPAPGSAGSGGNFRPAARRFSMDKAAGETDAPNGGGAPKAKDAAPVPDNAIKRVEWVKASVAALKGMDKTAASDWWASEKKRIGVIETALPTEYERLLDAYNEALDRGEAA